MPASRRGSAAHFPENARILAVCNPVNNKLRAFQARKSLGQNFLHDENVVRKIAQAIAAKPGELIVEIGPGFGLLTGYLVRSGCRLVAVEIDQRLLPELQSQFSDFANFTLVHGDFREFDLKTLQAPPAGVRLVGNIPYHITSSIIFTAFEQHELIDDMVLMVQKEVAERIVAGPGSKRYGILSVISQTFSRPELLFTVSRHVFVPKPEVDSAIVRWDFRQKQQPPPTDAGFYRQLVKRAFGQRRKTLRNTLKAAYPLERLPETWQAKLQQRPEELDIETYIRLANILHGGSDL